MEGISEREAAVHQFVVDSQPERYLLEWGKGVAIEWSDLRENCNRSSWFALDAQFVVNGVVMLHARGITICDGALYINQFSVHEDCPRKAGVGAAALRALRNICRIHLGGCGLMINELRQDQAVALSNFCEKHGGERRVPAGASPAENRAYYYFSNDHKET